MESGLQVTGIFTEEEETLQIASLRHVRTQSGRQLAICEPEIILTRTRHAGILISEFQTPDCEENTLLLFESPNLWRFVTTTQADHYSRLTHPVMTSVLKRSTSLLNQVIKLFHSSNIVKRFAQLTSACFVDIFTDI